MKRRRRQTVADVDVRFIAFIQITCGSAFTYPFFSAHSGYVRMSLSVCVGRLPSAVHQIIALPGGHVQRSRFDLRDQFSTKKRLPMIQPSNDRQMDAFGWPYKRGCLTNAEISQTRRFCRRACSTAGAQRNMRSREKSPTQSKREKLLLEFGGRRENFLSRRRRRRL